VTMSRGVFLLLAAGALALLISAPARALSLEPFKDELFAYPAILESQDGGDYRVVDYRESRDINGRDEVPERRVKRPYVSLGVRSKQQDLKLKTPAGEIRHYAVGRKEGASVIVVYLHGKGGSRRQGVDDYTFGGNFNRIKNLMVGNGGLYLSPDFSDFGAAGKTEVAALIGHYLGASPGARLFVACGSMGGYICWQLAADSEIGPKLSGLLLLGSIFDESFRGTAAFKRRLPLFFGHGSGDRVFPVEGIEAFYRSLRETKGGYPVRLVRFETGSHGTPIRMTDWRETLNWMLSLAN
jgi:pimeloyl-ACP methyl ester carboxylesterase